MYKKKFVVTSAVRLLLLQYTNLQSEKSLPPQPMFTYFDTFL